jgi:hypothetical protein
MVFRAPSCGCLTIDACLRVRTPSYSDICSEGTATCPTSSLVVRPSSVPLEDVTSILKGDTHAPTVLQRLVEDSDSAFAPPISCPPLCPGQAASTAIHVADVRVETTNAARVLVITTATARQLLTSSYGSRVTNAARALVTTTATARQLLTSSYGSRVLTSAAYSSAGIQYSASCDASGFISASTGACTNVSNPDHRNCAFGAADACVRCPLGALCPGGFRAWPLIGYYTTSERSSAVVACVPPASERCIGWSSTLNAVECGKGYRQSSPGCKACAFAYYQDQVTGQVSSLY